MVKAPDSSSGHLCWREFDPHRMYFFEGWVLKKWRSRVSTLCLTHAKRALYHLSYTPSTLCTSMHKTHVQIPSREVFLQICLSVIHRAESWDFFRKWVFACQTETQTFRQVQCAEPWWLAWCVVIPEAVTEETDFLVPKIHCLNKLRDKSRTCVGFCACKSAVSC